MKSQPVASNFSNVRVPPLDLPSGMITSAERRFLYDLARNHHTSTGALVEIGTWLGCSTLHLAAGLRDAGRGDAVHAYDDYLWRPSMARKSSIELGVGESFHNHFLTQTQALSAHIYSKVASVSNLGWTGGMIETMVVDAPKTWRGIRGLFRQIAPHLVPGQSRIAFQDYLHFPSYEISMYLGSTEAFEIDTVVLEGWTVVFTLSRPIDPVHLENNFHYKSMTKAQIDIIWEGILAPLPKYGRDILAAAYPMTLWQLGHHEAAEEAMMRAKISNDAARLAIHKLAGRTEPHMVWAHSRLRTLLSDN